MKKETMDKLDKMSLMYLLEKISIGNIVRGIAFIFNRVEKCVTSTAEKVKTAAKEETAKKQEPSHKPV